jgi:DNA (cytosine-5)-methyltransferase 1
MISPQFNLPVHSEITIDLFAGGGGASTGIEQAIGRAVDIAINHDPEAVALHQANHPQTRHFVSDVFEVDPITVTDGMPVGLLWASPDCKHFSKAKGGKPVSKKIRSLAGVVIKWAKLVRPRVICLENVEEFQTWGPLIKRKVVTTDAEGNTTEAWGEFPCPQRKGQTFKRWVSSLRGMGYAVEWRELRACDFGAPTIRKRLFLVARCDGQPIVWPEATHAAPDSLQVKAKKAKPWRTAAECIDWSIAAPSIFERKKPLAEATCRRIAKGIMRYVVDAKEPFIVNTRNGEREGQQAHVDSDRPRIPRRSCRAGIGPSHDRDCQRQQPTLHASR